MHKAWLVQLKDLEYKHATYMTKAEEKNKNKIIKDPKDEDFVPAEDLSLLLNTLPDKIREHLEKHNLDRLIEIVLDYERLPETRFFGGERLDLGSEPVSLGDINYVVNRIGDFTSDNRAGIERTLHRISCIRNRKGEIIGLTCRVGRTATGTIDAIRDLMDSRESILFLGPPGVGKTTKLREMARVLADDLNKRVIVIDTSNEIAGDGDIPHRGIGKARRMQVSRPELQHSVMIEAVENHTPEVIIIDEIGTELEAQAARTIAERGVQLIGTAHGNSLENLLKNPTLSDLVGGIQTATLGDEEAKRRGTQKTILERTAEPTFHIAIEILDHQKMAIHKNVKQAVDDMLRGKVLYPEVRKIDRETGKVEIVTARETITPEGQVSISTTKSPREPINVYPYAVSRGQLERVIGFLDLPASVCKTIDEANIILALKNYAKHGAKIIELSKKHKIPLYTVKTNTIEDIQRALKTVFPDLVSDFVMDDVGSEETRDDEKDLALEEVRTAINVVMDTDKAVDLTPRSANLRKLQQELIEQYKLDSLSIGQEPRRRIRIFPPPRPGESV